MRRKELIPCSKSGAHKSTKILGDICIIFMNSILSSMHHHHEHHHQCHMWELSSSRVGAFYITEISSRASRAMLSMCLKRPSSAHRTQVKPNKSLSPPVWSVPYVIIPPLTSAPTHQINKYKIYFNSGVAFIYR